MKIHLYIAFMFCFVLSVQAQNSSEYRIVRSNLGSSGSSNTIVTSKGTYNVSQSIGQASVIGTNYSNGYYLRQGYQQPLSKIKVINDFNENDLIAKVYPNPFKESVLVSFSDSMSKNISVLVFDINGKLIYSQDYQPSQKIQVNLNNLSSGTYVLKVSSNNKLFRTKLIKI